MATIDTEAAARRLARVILSDIDLYMRERPKAGESREAQLEEGRRLFASRVTPELVPVFAMVLADRAAGRVDQAPPAALAVAPPVAAALPPVASQGGSSLQTALTPKTAPVANPIRVLSADNTLFFKVVPTIVLIGVNGLLWGLGKWRPLGLIYWIFPLWWAWVAAKFKRVALDETSLRVSNFVHEIVVPFHQIARVSERLRPLRAIVVEFSQRTRFGRRIEFSPLGSSHPPPPHPFLIELENAIGAARRAKEAGVTRG